MNDLHVALANGGNVLRALRGRVPEFTGAEAITKVMASELIYKEGTTLKGNKPPKPWLRPLALFSFGLSSLTPPCYISPLLKCDCPGCILH